MRVIEMAPIVALLFLCVVLTVQAGPVMRFMDATAQGLHTPRTYVQDVLTTPRTKAVVGEGSP
jgi:multicomponent K+:H+ antiporter subunit D